ncbi:MAG: helicase-related protein [Ilumatobacteraceae bacterium]
MAVLEHLTPGARVTGLVPGEVVEVVASRWAGSRSVVLTYRTQAGWVDEQIVPRELEGELGLVESGQAWSFAGDGALFRLVAEARRIRLAYLFDERLAVHLSVIEPLPHQIMAVYGDMLPRQPLRFCLADDPGAGKTIMAGLYIKELMLRGDLQRCLIVAPGGLVTQWQDELAEKFSLDFTILTRELIDSSRHGDPFGERNLMIARLDHLSRNEDLVTKLRTLDWDLVVVDEAHRMAAHYFGNEVKETKRYRLGKTLGATTRHFLLMTATPHAGKEEDFQLFMALLDADRFEGKQHDRVHTLDVTDMMRRMVKERLLRFDGRPLFPERRATTVPYQLSGPEGQLYADVTDYVANEMNRAERLAAEGKGRRGNRVGFAVTVLQRRLASSPEAIYQSLKRRRQRLEARAQEARIQARSTRIVSETRLSVALDESDGDDFDADIEDLDDAELEMVEEELADNASSADNLAELEVEIQILAKLEAQADRVRQSGVDKKWTELLGLVRDSPEMFEPDGTRHKLIVFTEHRDTLNYLVAKLSTYLGRADAVVAIHGGVAREHRKVIQERFTQDKDCVVLVATDAAGEGLNLQRAHLLVNYDLPWNPNRIEQRFGRVHRIGQTEVCHLWNLVADDTREGQVYLRLLDKLAAMRDALGKDQVFDVLGDALPGHELRDLLLQAIRYGDQPDVRARLDQVIDAKVGDGLAELVREHALSSEMLSTADLERIRVDMLEAEARKLQPGYIHAWFTEAFSRLGGRMSQPESGRFEVSFVPAEIRNRDRLIGVGAPVIAKYQRVTFEKHLIRVEGQPLAELIGPGHPLLEAVLDITLERHRDLLTTGAVLVDTTDPATEPHVLVLLEHAITDARTDAAGNRRTVSRRFEFVALTEYGEPQAAGYAPYLDARPATADELAVIEPRMRQMGWLGDQLETRALDYGIDVLTAEHLTEVKVRTLARIAKVKHAVYDRLTREINYWDHRANELQLNVDAGKAINLNVGQAQARADELQRRLHTRLNELEREAQLASRSPTIVGVALVVPAGMLATAGTDKATCPPSRTFNTEAVERRALDAVLSVEHRLNHHWGEVPHNNLGYDIRSTDRNGTITFIEVKGRIAGANTFNVTQNELRFAANIPDDYLLALVEVSPDGPAHDTVRYLRKPYGSGVNLPFGTTATTLNWSEYWDRAQPPSQPAPWPPPTGTPR